MGSRLVGLVFQRRRPLETSTLTVMPARIALGAELLICMMVGTPSSRAMMATLVSGDARSMSSADAGGSAATQPEIRGQ